MHRHLFLSDIKGDLGLRPAARSPRDFQFAIFIFFRSFHGSLWGCDSKKLIGNPMEWKLRVKKSQQTVLHYLNQIAFF
ncbi:MAG: hypothetical protein Ct9H90mP27_2430 [Gammaproteobacteria bacterium]|nr:MAG: hypothetical protein Ct9H90mP27_2430 [Gammaproteobacteria bacterium]